MNQRKTSTAQIYVDMHTKNMQKECPGSIYERSKYISIMILEEDTKSNFFMRDIVYMPIDDAYKKYIEVELFTYPEPYENLHVVYPEILRKRILSQMSLSEVDHSLDVKECFERFKEGKEEKSDRVMLDNKLHFDDNLVDWQVSSDLNLRDEAEKVIKKSCIGSWLIRRSSVKEQDDIKVRVITVNGFNGIIRNFLFSHINGFGYALTDAIRGQSMPKVGDKNTVRITMAFYSLPDVLMFLKSQGLNLSNIL